MTTNTTKQSLPFEDAFFHKKDFWDEHYKTNSQRDSDWYMTYEHLAPILHPILQKNHKILVIGCGESELSFKLFDDGYQDVVSIDISSVVVNKMNSTKGDRLLTFLEMDVSQMTFPDNTFDIVFDKGTLDSLLTSTESFSTCTEGISEIRRVLKPTTGRFLLVSFGGHDIYSYLLEEEGKMTIEEMYEIQMPWGQYFFYKVYK